MMMMMMLMQSQCQGKFMHKHDFLFNSLVARSLARSLAIEIISRRNGRQERNQQNVSLFYGNKT